MPPAIATASSKKSDDQVCNLDSPYQARANLVTQARWIVSPTPAALDRPPKLIGNQLDDSQ
jgi:hypothetical protein